MPLITDYGTLQTAVADWLYRAGDTNFSSNAPLFVSQFENDFKRRVRVLEMQQLDTITLTSGQVALPPGFLEATRLQLTNLPSGTPNQVLTYVTPERSAALDATTSPSGVVQWYTILAGTIIISPQNWVPSGAVAEMLFYTFTKLKDAAGGTNWLLADHDDIYLYGALTQGAAYIDDKETVTFWQNKLDAGMAALLEADKKKRFGGPLQVLPSMQFRTTRRTRP